MTILLTRSAQLFSREYRHQARILLLASLIPWVGNIIYISDLSPIKGLDVTPISFALSVLLTGWSVFRLQLFGLIPIARDLVVEYANDGMLVLDDKNQILDANAAAARLLFSGMESFLGQKIELVLKNHPELVSRLRRKSAGRMEILARTQPPRYLDVNVTPLHEQNGSINGRIFIIRDITDLKKMENEEHEQRMLASSLSDVASALNSLRDVNDVLDRILLDVKKVVPHTAASIALVDEEHIISFVRFRGFHKSGLGNVVSRIKLNLDEVHTFKTMFVSHKPLKIDNTENDPDWLPIKNSEWIKSFVGAPIIIDNKVIGFLNLDGKKPGFFSPKSAKWLQAFANTAALAIENARLFEGMQRMAITDGLTGLYNHLHFEELADKEIARAVRYQKPLSLLMIDLDHF